ncbi:hypothetical protein BDY24DRAFT_228569 [Mrakia frigida]|uniref:uncharacterized protein n=1 Tax=Mrakia frigida TaxID=29902 RepID=UPI003FCC037B
MGEQYLGKKHHGMGFLETNSRPDLALVVPILSRLTGRPSTPIILIGGKNMGSYADLKALDNEDGELEDLLKKAGSTLGLEKVKRVEKERLLRIAMEKIRASLPVEEREDVTLEAIAEAVAEVVAEEAVAEEARDEAVAEEKREQALEMSQEELVEEEALAQDAMDRVLADDAKAAALDAALEEVLGDRSTPTEEEAFALEEEKFVITQGDAHYEPGEVEEFVLNEDDNQPEEEEDYDFQPLEA